MIDGVAYNKLHIVNIKSTKNNTILSVSDSTGNVLYKTSAVWKFFGQNIESIENSSFFFQLGYLWV